jgi:alditol oxidase
VNATEPMSAQPFDTHRNWAGNYIYRASTVHRPTSVDELRDVVARAPRIRALGSRHCFNDIADSAELVSTEALEATVEIDTATATARVSGGARYGTVAAHLHEHGWALHSMASLPHISVAGAVATGTHGSGDRVASLSTAVVGLELVAGDGELHRIGPDDTDLAGAVVSLGALGVVTSVDLRVEPSYDVSQVVHPGLPWSTVLEHFDEVTSSADSVSLFTDWTGPAVGQVWRKTRVAAGQPGAGQPEVGRSGAGRLEAGLPEARRSEARLSEAGLSEASDSEAERSGAADGPTQGWGSAVRRSGLFDGAPPATVAMHPLPGVDPVSTTEQLGVPGPWHARLPHFRMEFTPSFGTELQSEYVIPREHAPAAIEVLRGMSDRITPLLLISEVRTIAADELWMSMAAGRDSVALHFTWQQRQSEVEALLPALEEALLPFAPRPHWGKLFTPSVAGAPDHLAAVYPRLAEFRALSSRLDPEGTFRNTYLERHGLVG